MGEIDFCYGFDQAKVFEDLDKYQLQLCKRESNERSQSYTEQNN